MEGLLAANHGFFSQLCATAINHTFIGKPLEIQIFHIKTLLFIGQLRPDKEGSIHWLGEKSSFGIKRSNIIPKNSRESKIATLFNFGLESKQSIMQ